MRQDKFCVSKRELKIQKVCQPWKPNLWLLFAPSLKGFLLSPSNQIINIKSMDESHWKFKQNIDLFGNILWNFDDLKKNYKKNNNNRNETIIHSYHLSLKMITTHLLRRIWSIFQSIFLNFTSTQREHRPTGRKWRQCGIKHFRLASNWRIHRSVSKSSISTAFTWFQIFRSWGVLSLETIEVIVTFIFEFSSIQILIILLLIRRRVVVVLLIARHSWVTFRGM